MGVIEFLNNVIAENPYLVVKQDGKRKSVPLNEVKDQSAVLGFITDRLKDYRIGLKVELTETPPTTGV